MTETPSTPAPAPTTTPAVATPTDSGQAPSTTPEPSIPKSRFDEVNTRAKAAEAELERIKADQEKNDREAAEKNGEWQKLATQHTTTIAELKPKLKTAEERADRYAAVLTEHVKGLRKDVPEYVLPLLDKLEPDEQLDYITKNADKWAPETAGTAPPRGAGPSPRSAGSPGRDELIRKTEAEMRASGRYPRF